MSRTRSPSLDHDHAADVPGALDQALADADELGLAARVDAVLAGAVLARDLADAGVDAEPPQRALHDAGDRCGSGRACRTRCPARGRPTRTRSCSRGRRPRARPRAAGPPRSRRRARRAPRPGSRGWSRSCLPNATIAPGRASRNVSGSSPRGHALEDRARDGGVVGRAVRERVPDQVQRPGRSTRRDAVPCTSSPEPGSVSHTSKIGGT